MINIVFSTEIRGKEVLKALQNTFGESTPLKLIFLTDSYIKDITTQESEELLKKIYREAQNRKWDKNDTYFFVCIGSLIANAIGYTKAKEVLDKQGIKSYLLAFDGKKNRYIAYTWEGKMVYDYL